ncbi:hypothetical protein [uncultured Ruegeria sp.]|uniref:hypothetical protein n=1 Tax=uncultured Ruegeria sp. TaxID=259304 RepID=UPI00263958AD|nr:hypothetical protein [uncultured Ruegeria sp.]
MVKIFCDNPGSCIEPDGYELDNDSWETDCPDCGKTARHHHWEEVVGGSINQYFTIQCEHCGHISGNGLDVDEIERSLCPFDVIIGEFEGYIAGLMEEVCQRLDAIPTWVCNR